MYNRVITFRGASNIDAGVAHIRDNVAPLLRQQNGFRGLIASADREAGLVGALSLWATEVDRDASDSALAKTREEGLKIIGGQMSVEMFEEVLVDATRLPGVGDSLLIRRVSMDPAKVDENAEFFEREILPQIKAEPGFVAVRQMINRSTGDSLVGTVWTDAESMRAAAESAERRQSQAAGRVTFGEQSSRTILFIDMP